MIPVYCMEEHNEAFYYWGLAMEEGYIKRQGNVLFHVDHHDDSEAGAYFHDFSKPFESLIERKDFTYNVLGIADFIVPALYEGIFDKFYNMKSIFPAPFSEQERVVKRNSDGGLSVRPYQNLLHAAAKKEKKEGFAFYTYHEGSLTATGDLENVVLDIDLDYFSWDDHLSTVPPKRIEVTKKAYDEYMSDPYHAFRILPKRMLYMEEVEGRYYFRYQEPGIPRELTKEKYIRQRINNFIKWLKEQSWKPCFITICRSVHSGYLPECHAELVEGLVREGLAGLYELNYLND